MKHLFALALSFMLGLSGFAQGTIIFNNVSTQLIRVADGINPPYNAPLGTHVAFYYSPTPVYYPDDPALQLIPGGVGTIAPVSGQFNLGVKTTGTNAAPGSTIYASVRAWTGPYTTWDAALAAQSGGAYVLMNSSPVFQMGTGGLVNGNYLLPVALSTVAGFHGVVLGSMGIYVGHPSITRPGVLTNQFGFTLSCSSYPGPTLITVEACDAWDNIASASWVPLQQLVIRNGEGAYFSDPSWTNHPHRLYRAWAQY